MNSNVKLFLVATPIGNLKDFSSRAIETLNNVDCILCEDTRVTLKLLNHFNIKKTLISYNEYSDNFKLNNILNDMLNGRTFAIVSDAGMPCISDPGEELVKLCHNHNIKISVIPGASAFNSAVCVSGIDTKKFTFVGFLSKDKSERYKELSDIKEIKHTIIFYETPHRIKSALKEFLQVFGDRKICIIKEITKIYEDINLTTLSKAVLQYENITPKGEFVIVLEKCTENKQEITLDKAIIMAKELISNGYSIKDASKIISVETSIKKSDIYKVLIGNN